MRIRKGDKGKITKNFDISEFFSDSPSVTEHYLDDKLIEAVQIIRDYVGVAWRITSTYRTKKANEAAGGKDNSYHLRGMAVDSQPWYQSDFNTYMPIIVDDINKRGPLFQSLRRAGINGFGLYDNFIHIDTREANSKHEDGYGRFAIWDNRILKIRPDMELKATLETFFFTRRARRI